MGPWVSSSAPLCSAPWLLVLRLLLLLHGRRLPGFLRFSQHNPPLNFSLLVWSWVQRFLVSLKLEACLYLLASCVEGRHESKAKRSKGDVNRGEGGSWEVGEGRKEGRGKRIRGGIKTSLDGEEERTRKRRKKRKCGL